METAKNQGHAIIIDPISDTWAWLADVTGPVDADFAAAVEEQPEAQEDQSFKLETSMRLPSGSRK